MPAACAMRVSLEPARAPWGPQSKEMQRGREGKGVRNKAPLPLPQAWAGENLHSNWSGWTPSGEASEGSWVPSLSEPGVLRGERPDSGLHLALSSRRTKLDSWFR